MATTSNVPRPRTSNKATAATPPEVRCLCGCEGIVGKGKMFIAGHDARFKGYLQRAHRGNPRPTDPTMARLAANFESVTGRAVKADAVDICAAYNPEWLVFLGEKDSRAPKPQPAKAKPAAPPSAATETKAKPKAAKAPRAPKAKAA